MSCNFSNYYDKYGGVVAGFLNHYRTIDMNNILNIYDEKDGVACFCSFHTTEKDRRNHFKRLFNSSNRDNYKSEKICLN